MITWKRTFEQKIKSGKYNRYKSIGGRKRIWLGRVRGSRGKWGALTYTNSILLWQTVGGSSIMKDIVCGGADQVCVWGKEFERYTYIIILIKRQDRFKTCRIYQLNRQNRFYKQSKSRNPLRRRAEAWQICGIPAQLRKAHPLRIYQKGRADIQRRPTLYDCGTQSLAVLMVWKQWFYKNPDRRIWPSYAFV